MKVTVQHRLKGPGWGGQEGEVFGVPNCTRALSIDPQPASSSHEKVAFKAGHLLAARNTLTTRGCCSCCLLRLRPANPVSPSPHASLFPSS